jgi:hypothetical protein
MDRTLLHSTGEIERFASHEGLEVRSGNVDDPNGSNRLLADLHIIVNGGICIPHLSNGACDHRFSDHDVLDGDPGEIGHRDGVG